MKNIKILFSFCLFPAQLFSQSNKRDRFEFGISSGSVFPSRIQAADHIDFRPGGTYNFLNKQSLLIKGMADYCILPFCQVEYTLTMFPLSCRTLSMSAQARYSTLLLALD